MSVDRRYYRGHNLVAMRDGLANQSRYFHADHQGTTQCLTDSAGAVTDRFASDAWGVQVKRTGGSLNRHWYVGRSGYYRHLEAQIDYVRARTLALRASRWLAVDPDRIAGLTYGYASNTPASRIDPSGKQDVDDEYDFSFDPNDADQGSPAKKKEIITDILIVEDNEFQFSIQGSQYIAAFLNGHHQSRQHPWVGLGHEHPLLVSNPCLGGSGDITFEQDIYNHSYAGGLSCVGSFVLLAQMQKETSVVTKATPCRPRRLNPKARLLMGCSGGLGVTAQLDCARDALCRDYTNCLAGQLNSDYYRRSVKVIDPTKPAGIGNVWVCIGPNDTDPKNISGGGIWVKPLSCGTLALIRYTPNLRGQKLFRSIWKRWGFPGGPPVIPNKGLGTC